ncbi:MAG: enoyl-CoA hydratase-related protein, partial [bacterium]
MAEDKTSTEEKTESKIEEKSSEKLEKKTKTAAKKTSTRSRKKVAAKKPAAGAKPAAKAAAADKSKAATKRKTAAKKTAPKAAKPDTTTQTAEPAKTPPLKPALRFEETDSFSILTFDTPGKPVNILNPETMQQLDTMLDDLAQKTDLKALLFMSAKPGNFVAGADIEAIKNITTVAEGETAAKEGQRIYNKIAALPFPTIAVIDGTCLGGGLELSLACKYRIARHS